MTEERTEITSIDFIDDVNNQEEHDNDNNYIDIHQHQNDNFPNNNNNNNNNNTPAPWIEIDEIKILWMWDMLDHRKHFGEFMDFHWVKFFLSVVRLTIHLFDEQNITYVEGNESQAMSENRLDSMLTNISRCTNNY